MSTFGLPPPRRGSTRHRHFPNLCWLVCPAQAGANAIERQVFQYTIDLNKKRPRRRQPDRDEKKAPIKTTAREQLRKPAPSKTPEEIAAAEEKRQVARREYDRQRNKSPERVEYQRLYAQKRLHRARELGKCRNCSKPAIPGQSRCETCAEQHRQSRMRSYAERRAADKETRRTGFAQ